MRRLAWDQGFVAASPQCVHGAVGEPVRYDAWWPGASISAGTEEVTVRLPGVPALVLRPDGSREGIGAVFGVGGLIRGRWEWFLEPFDDGTIVNALLDLDVPGGERASSRRLHRLRVAVHRGLVGLKGALE